MKTFPESFAKNYADWSAVGWAMLLGHAPSPDKKPNGELAPRSAMRDREDDGGSLKAPKKAAAARKPALRKAPAKKRPAKKAKRRR